MMNKKNATSSIRAQENTRDRTAFALFAIKAKQKPDETRHTHMLNISDVNDNEKIVTIVTKKEEKRE